MQTVNDHSKLRLQLFYLDDLVHKASESLRKLEATAYENDANLCSGAD
jgi:hypothetical protein